MANDSIHQSPKTTPDHSGEINLVDLFVILWRWKWLILAVTALTAVIGTTYRYAQAPSHTIKAQVKPGITGYTKQGQPIRNHSVQDIKTWIENRGYEAKLSKHLNNKNLPVVECSTNPNTSILALWFHWHEPEEGEKLLRQVIESFANMDKNADLQLETMRLQYQIELNEKIIGYLRTKRKETQQLYNMVSNHLPHINDNTTQLNNLRSNLTTRDQDNNNLRIYSLAIQNNVQSVRLLQQSMINLDRELKQSVTEETERENNIKLLKQQLDSLSTIEVVQAVFSSPNPRNFNIIKFSILACIAGLLIGIVTAFLVEFWIKKRHEFRQKIQRTGE